MRTSLPPPDDAQLVSFPEVDAGPPIKVVGDFVEQGTLAVTGGAQGLHSALQEIFGDRVHVHPDG
ncbi:MAG: hypothetical protein BRD41_05405, partial [Bacteroidetes bacterium QS_1_63_11]